MHNRLNLVSIHIVKESDQQAKDNIFLNIRILNTILKPGFDLFLILRF